MRRGRQRLQPTTAIPAFPFSLSDPTLAARSSVVKEESSFYKVFVLSKRFGSLVKKMYVVLVTIELITLLARDLLDNAQLL